MSIFGGSAVDSKVVELSLENKQFESGAEKSLSTIEKLNKSLSLVGDTKGIDSIGSSLKNVKFDTLNNGVETARRGFSLLETVTFGFFSSLGSRIESTAESFARLITGIDPLIDGFTEYELKMDSVQTILMGAKTAEGLPVTLDLVNQKLEELNAYSDRTIYSFRDMTANIGKFTNAGVDLDTAVSAIQGISNAAALAGANAGEASRAMYNFSQALATGSVKLIDWKSIENANMATVEFKQTLIDTAVELGTVKEAGDGLYESLGEGKAAEAFNATTKFNDALASQWMTSEVLTTALAKYSDETTDLGRRAFEAATKVKTFSQLMDTLKEAAGSGWAQTFEILIGDFEEARSFFTFLSNEIGGVIGGMADARNNFLKAAFEAPPKIINAEMWENLNLTSREADALYKALLNVGEAHGYAFDIHTLAAFKMSLEEGWLTADMLKEALGTVGEAGETASGGIEKIREAALGVIRGDYGNDMEERFRQLEEAGLDPQLVQDYVNTIHELAGGTWNVTDAMLDQADAQYEAQAGLSNLSDEELKAMGYTESQIETLRSLAKQLDSTGTKLNKVADDSDQISNRTKIIMSIQGIIRNILKLGGLVKEVFSSIFPPATTDMVTNFADGFVALAAAFNQFVLNALAPGSAVRNILSAIFSVLRAGITIIGSVIKVIFDLRNKIVAAVMPVALNVLGFISKIIAAIAQFIIVLNPIQRVVDLFTSLGSTIQKTALGIFDSFKNSWKLAEIGKQFGLVGTLMNTAFVPYLKKTADRWDDFTARLNKKGGLDYAFSSWDAFKETVGDFKTSVIDYFLKFPGFKQLGTAFKTLGDSIRQELIERGFPVEKIETFFGTIWNWLSGKGKKIKDFFGNLFSSKKISVDLQTIKMAFGRTWDNILDLFDRLKAAWESFTKKVSDLGGFKLSNIGNIFKAFFETIIPELTSKDVFAPLKSGFKFLFEDIDEIIGENFGINFTTIKDTVVGWFYSIKEALSGFSLKDLFSGLFGGSESEEAAEAATKEGGNIISRAFKGIASLFGPMTVYADDLDESLDSPEIQDKIITLSKTVADAAPALESGVGTITACFKDVGDAASTVADVVGGGGKSPGEVIFGFFDWLKKAMSGVQNILGPIGTVAAALLTFKGVGSVAESIGNMINGIKGAEAVSAALNKAKAKELKAKALLEIAVAIGILAGALLLVSKVKDPGKSFLMLAGLAGGLLAFGLILSKMKVENISKGTRGLLELSVALGILAAVVFLISFIKPERAKKGAIYLVGLLAILTTAVWAITKLGGDGKAVAGAGAGLLAISSAIAILVGVMFLLTLMKWDKYRDSLIKLGGIIVVLIATVALMAGVSKLLGPIKQTQKMMLGLAAVIAVIAGAMFLISLIDPKKLPAIVIALGVLMGIAAVMMAAASKMDPGAFKPIAAVVAMIAVIAISLIALSTINQDNLVRSALVLGGLMAVIIVLALVLNHAKDIKVGSIVALAVMVGVIGGVIGLLATFTDTDAALKAAEGLALVVAAVALLAFALGNVGKVSFVGGLKIIGLVAIIAAIGVIAGYLISNMSPETQAKAMEALDMAVTFMQKIGEMIGALVGGVLAGFNNAAFDPAVGENICAFMESLAPLGDMQPIDFGALAQVIGAVLLVDMAGFVSGLLSIVTEWTNGKSAAETFSDDLTAISGAFGTWQTTLQGFDKFVELPVDAFNGAVAAVLAVSFAGLVAGLVDQVAEWVTGKTATQIFSDDLTAISGAFSTWQTTLNGFEEFKTLPTGAFDDAVEAIKKASLTGLRTSLADKVKEWIDSDGQGTIDTFSEDLTTLSTAFGKWQETMAGYGDKVPDVTGLNDVIDVIDSIPKEGGLFGPIVALYEGAPDWEQFDTNLESLSRSMTIAKARLGKFDSFTFNKAVMDDIVSAIDAIPNTGGLIPAIKNFVFGEADFDVFDQNCVALGKAITSFSDNLGNIDATKVEAASKAGESLALITSTLSSGSYGDNPTATISALGGEMVTFGQCMQEFTAAISDVEATSQAATAALNLSTAASTLAEIQLDGSDIADESTVTAFTDNINTLVSKLTELDGQTFPGVDRLKQAVDTLNETDLETPETTTTETTVDVKVNTSGAEDAGKAMTASFEQGASGMASAASSAAQAAADAIRNSSSQFQSIGFDLMSYLGAGIINNSSYPSTQARLSVGYAIAAASSAASGASEAGRDFATGFANGISNHEYFMTAAARIATRHAINASKDEEGAASPAKETKKLGKWFTQGFANGITEDTKLAVRASRNLVDEAEDGLLAAGNMINDLLSDEMDATPTITPVLDLSEIQNGANGIGRMLSDSSINVNGISGSVARRTTNGDILSALTALRGSVESGRTGNTYVVNGVTYDDGSNVSSAVASLVRAVRMERRA